LNGQSAEAVRADLERQNLSPERLEPLIPQKVHQGSRPGTIVLFQKTDPKTLGKLIALYEHKVFTQGVIWGINSFDQWGVELGKKLAEQLIPAVQDPSAAHKVSAGVAKLLGKMAEWRGNS
jgi:glucose-6-phosphate isomerase